MENDMSASDITMEEKQKSRTIAIEAIALGEKVLSGIGILAANYVKHIQRLDTKNTYIIYTMREQRHLKDTPGTWVYHRWDIMDTLFNKRERTISRLSNTNVDHYVIKLYLRIIRKFASMGLIVLQWLYPIWLPFSLWINRADVYVSTSAYFYPPFFLSQLRKISFVYDLAWKLLPETLDPGNRKHMQRYAKKNIGKADQLVSISENTKKDVQRLLDIQTNNTVILPAVDPAVFYPAKSSIIQCVKEKYTIRKKYILSVCTLEPRKNLKLLLRAYAKAKDGQKYELVLTGKMGWLHSDLPDYIKHLDIENNIILTEYVPITDLAPLYSGAEVFVYPSMYEGFGLPVLEAMQCGCPVIVSNNSSLPEVVGGAGLLIPTNDEEALTSSLERVLSDHALRDELIMKGLKRSERFSWENSVKWFLELY